MISVWKEIGPYATEEEARDYLGPLIAKNKAEREQFDRLFSTYAPLLSFTAEAEDPTEIPAELQENSLVDTTEERPSRRFYIYSGILLALLLAVFSNWLYHRIYPTVVQGCMDQSALNYDSLANEDCCCQYPEEEAITQVIGCRDTAAINYNPNAVVDCEDCCNYTGCTDENALNYNPKATVACEDCCEYAPQPSVAEIAQNDSISVVPILAFKPLNLPYLPKFAASKWTWILDHKFLFSWILTGILFAIALVVFLWKRARSRYIARRSTGEEPPYQLPIRISQTHPIAVTEDFYLALNQLRGREISARQLLDLPKTIKATLKQGGLIDFQYRHLTQSVEYLILIDKHNNQDHQAQLFEHIYQYFVRHEIYAHRYFFDGDPTYCWNDNHPGGIALERLVQLYQHARLLILSDGHSFINPSSGELELATGTLCEWNLRVLLTPSPTAGWDYREAMLGKLFTVLPSSVEGMMSIIQHIEDLPAPSLREWKYQIGKKDHPIHLDDVDPVPALKVYFPQEIIQWIAACALYPELHWDLSLEIGASLEAESGKLVNFHNIRRIARLEWFQFGYIPNEIRQQLIDSVLTKENEEKARLAIILILEQNVPQNQQSYAYEQHQLHLAANQLLVSQLPEERRKWLEKYREQHAKMIGEDQVTVQALDRYFNRYLDFELPKAFRNFFYPDGRMVLGTRNWTPFFIAGMVSLFLWGISSILPSSCIGNKAQLPFSEDLYCLVDARDSLAFFAHEVKIHLDSLRMEEAQDRVQEVDRLFAAHTLLDTFTRQVQEAQWNRALAFYQSGGYSNVLSILEVSLRSEQMGLLLQREFQHLRGLAALYEGNDSIAQQIATDLAPYATDLVHPGLLELTTYDFVDSLINSRIRIRLDGKYGFLDEMGQPQWNENLPPYDHATNYKRDSAVVKVDGQQCIVDLRGNQLECFYDNSQENPGLAAFDNRTLLNERLRQYDFADIMRSNRIRVRLNGRYGFLNGNGEALWSGDTLPYDYALNYSGDSALVSINNRQCFINTSGQELRCYQTLTPFQDRQSQLWGYRNEKGEVIISPIFLEAGPINTSEPARVQNQNSSYNFLNIYGELIHSRDFQAALSFSSGLAIVQIGDKWGAINTSGQVVIPMIYDEFSNFQNGRAQVSKNKQVFSINTQGTCISGNCPEELVILGYDDEKGTSLSNITLELYEITDDGFEVRIDSTTNKSGNRFLFDVDLSKKLRVRVIKSGYMPKEEDWVFSAEEIEKGNNRVVREVRLNRLFLWDFLPMALFFDNDQPNTIKYSPNTTKTYIETNTEYFEKRDSFIKEFTKGMDADEKFLTTQRFIDLFDKEILAGRLQLLAFSEVLLDYLESSNASIAMTIKGFASPLGTPSYNELLSMRRINSVYNHFTDFENGAFLPYLTSGRLSFKKEPEGEPAVIPDGISDDKNDDKNSIFSIIVSVERRVEITSLTISE